MQMKLDWEPSAYKSAAGAAKALYGAICKKAKKEGWDPEGEVWISSPAESLQRGLVGEVWHVCWESGPHDWACSVFASGQWGHVETYYGFDLAFYP
jgi:hypothetical protein